MEAIEDTYGDAVRVLLELKSSISRWQSSTYCETRNNTFHSYLRLLSKSLFPYNIGPVFRLLERVEAQHATVQQLSWQKATDQDSLADIGQLGKAA